MDLSGNKQRVLAEAIRARIAWCDGELAKATTDDAKATLGSDKECLVAMLAELMPVRRTTEPGHA